MTVVLLVSALSVQAQLKPPQQTDSLIASSANHQDDEDFCGASFCGVYGEPEASLAGRTVVGVIRRPFCDVPEGEKIVVRISVDRYGAVRQVSVCDKETAVTDSCLLEEVRIAAMRTRFSKKADAPEMQDGTITYIFKSEDIKEDFPADLEMRLSEIQDEQPLFMGHDKKYFSEWVTSQLKYPKSARRARIEGVVHLCFTLDEEGDVTNVRVVKSLEPSLDMEAVRVVSSSPRWTPRKIDGIPVSTTFNFPVVFVLR